MGEWDTMAQCEYWQTELTQEIPKHSWAGTLARQWNSAVNQREVPGDT
jgi:hypothetical protein